MRALLRLAVVVLLLSGSAWAQVTDDGESGVLTGTGGAWTSLVAPSSNTIALSATAAHRGNAGILLTDTDSSTGNGVQNYLEFAPASAPSFTFYSYRFWVRVGSSTGTATLRIATVETQSCAAGQSLELLVDEPSGALSIAGFGDHCQPFRRTSTATLPTGTWHLVELQLQGPANAWAEASARLYVDGALAAEQRGLTFATLTMKSLRLGEIDSSPMSFTGELHFDDVRSTTAAQGTFLAVTAGSVVSNGVCAPVTVQMLDVKGVAQNPPYAVTATLGVTAGTGAFYSDVNCQNVTTSVSIPTNKTFANTYFKGSGGSSWTVTASNPDFITSPSVLPAEVGRLSFNPLATIMGAGLPWKLVVQRQQLNGTPIGAGAQALTVTVTSTSTTGQFNASAEATPGWTATGTVTIPPQSSTATLFYRDPSLGTPTLTASAASWASDPKTVSVGPDVLQQDFEANVLYEFDDPPSSLRAGFNSYWPQSSINTLLPSALAAHRGNYGLRHTDAESLTGAGGQNSARGICAPLTGDLYYRLWYRLASSNSTGDVNIAETQWGANGNVMIVDAQFPGPAFGFNVGLQSAAPPALGGTFTPGTWHLLELASLGVGTSSGTAKLWVDGVPMATIGAQPWTTTKTDLLILSANYEFNQAFTGENDYDDVRISLNPPASTLRVTPQLTSTTVGSCLPLQLELLDSSGNAAPAPYAMTPTLQLTSGSGTFHPDSACMGIATVGLSPGATSTTVYFKPSAAGTASLSATHPDFLSAPAADVTVSGGAGVASTLAFLNASPSISAGGCAGPMQLAREDSTGAQIVSSSAWSVTLSTDRPATGAFFQDAACNTALTGTLDAAAGTSATPTFYYRETKVPGATVTASSPSLIDATQKVNVTALAASTLSVTGFPSSLTAGEGGTFTVTALDAFGNVDPTYAGTITLSSDAPGTTFTPATYAFVPATDNGAHAGLTARFTTAGTWALLATDQTNPSIAGHQAPIQVTDGTVSPGNEDAGTTEPSVHQKLAVGCGCATGSESVLTCALLALIGVASRRRSRT